MARIDIGAGQRPTRRDDLVLGTAGDDVITDPGGNDAILAGAPAERPSSTSATPSGRIR